MSKELEALERLAMPDEIHIKECKKLGIGLTEDYDVVEKALQRLEAIDNANPSEALKGLEKICDVSKNDMDINIGWIFKHEIDTIKQALLKAQKEHNSINLLMQELDCKDFVELRKYARCGYEKLNKKDLHLER